MSVRRQGFWNQWQLKLRESLAHLVGFIMWLVQKTNENQVEELLSSPARSK